MKVVFILTAVFLCLLAGCSTNKYSEEYNSGRSQNLEDLDEFKIEAAVYGYLLERHFSDQDEYTAIFLEGSDARVAALIRKFPNHVPPIKPSDRIQLHPNQTPIDKDTGKLAMILSAKAMDPTNGVAEAIGTWYAGGAVSGLYAFVLVKVGGEWTIQSVK
jgi:hypothetical protein